jgi:hypothetical protein
MKQSHRLTQLRSLFRFKALVVCLLVIVFLTSPSISIAIERSIGERVDWPIADGGRLRLATESARTTKSQDPKGYKRTAKELVDNLIAEDYGAVRRNFSEQMKQTVSEEQIAQVWSSVVQQLGSYRSQGPPQLIKDQGFDAVVIRCQMERGAVTVEVVYDNQDKIGGLWVRPAQ